MQKTKSARFTFLVSVLLALSMILLSFSMFGIKGSANTRADVTGVKFDSTFAGAGELKFYISVTPATLKTGNYWEGSLKNVISQDELDAFTTKITINGKTLQQYMNEKFVKYVPANSAGQLDIVFDNAKGGEFLTFGDEIIVFEKGCKFPGVSGALEEDITYKFNFVSGGIATAEKVVEPTVEPAKVTGVKLDSTFAGAGELKLYISVSPASLTSGNYWEGSVKDVITQEELDAFTTKITLNGKTLQQYMSEGFIKYIPSNNPGQLDVVFDNAKGDGFLTFGDEIIVFEKGCKFPGVSGALEEDITYKFNFVSGGIATAEKVVEPTVEPAKVTGVKLDSTFAGAGELKLYISVSPASLTSGNYWEGSVKDVITQEELDAFTTKITLNGKTLQQYMSEGFIKYIPSNNPGQLDVVFDNAKGDGFLTFGDEIIVFEKGCKFPGAGGALEEDVTYKFSFVQGGVADGTLEGEKEPENPPKDPDDKPTSDKFEEGTITWAGVHHYDSKNYIVHLNVSLKTLVAGQKYYDNGEIVNMSENQFWQFADYIFFNGYSFKDLIEMDPEIFITIQASEGRTDNIEFTVSPEALERNDIPYYGTTGKGETIDLRAGCLLPNKTEIKTNIAWNVTPGQPQGTQTTPSNITKKPVRYYDGSTDESTDNKPNKDPSENPSGGSEKEEDNTFIIEGLLSDESGKKLGGVSMSIHGATTTTLITEEDGSFFLTKMEAGEYTFLVIQSGKVSTHKFNIALSATVNKTSLSEDGKTLTVPEQAEAISLNLILDSSNNLKIGSTSVLTWEDGYVPSGDDNAYGNAPLTGEKFAYGILVLFAASLAGVLLIRKRINVR